jgi:hypothetical protein
MSSQAGEPYTTSAEIELVGTGGTTLDCDGWKVIFAESEEVSMEDGSAANVLDGNPSASSAVNALALTPAAVQPRIARSRGTPRCSYFARATT